MDSSRRLRRGGRPGSRCAVIALAASFSSLPAAAQVLTIREATATLPDGIQATVDAFRADLGDPNNGNARGSQGSGRRQVTWDGGDNDAAPARLPGDFFNLVAPRGIEFPGQSNLQVSADASPAVPGTPAEFGNVNATYPTAFAPFSIPRLFVPLASRTLDASFYVPGTDQPAGVAGFGAVFTDVDTAGTTRIEFFGEQGLLLARDVLATPGDASVSFLGATFDRPVLRVRITLGNSPVGPNDVTQGSTADVVALDDLLYGEPFPVADVRVSERVLEVFGSSGDDSIRVKQTKKKATVKLNGASWSFPAGTLDQIHVRANGGDDDVRVSASVPVAVDGGAGDDRVRGANAPQLLVGGAGADEIRGGKRDDVLVAGAPIAAEGPSRAALRAILLTWAADAPYADRVDALRTASGSEALTDATLDDSDSGDAARGGKGEDWFLGADPGEALDQAAGELFDLL